MIKEERKIYLSNKNKKLISKLNDLIGAQPNKIMSQRRLALILNCSNSTIARWLSGKSTLSIDTAIRICDILGLDKTEYLDYSDIDFGKTFSENFNKLTT